MAKTKHALDILDKRLRGNPKLAKMVTRETLHERTGRKACGHPHCSVSTTISGHLSFGSGRLDDYGYWQKPCGRCAEAYEKEYPWQGSCWPFGKNHGPGYDEIYDATMTIGEVICLRK